MFDEPSMPLRNAMACVRAMENRRLGGVRRVTPRSKLSVNRPELPNSQPESRGELNFDLTQNAACSPQTSPEDMIRCI